METQYRVVSLKSRWFRRNKGMKRKEEESNTLRLQKGGSVIVRALRLCPTGMYLRTRAYHIALVERNIFSDSSKSL